MDTANPLANQSTIALVLLHQYADSDPYRALDPGRRALVQEAIESLTAFEESGPARQSPPGDDPTCDRDAGQDRTTPTGADASTRGGGSTGSPDASTDGPDASFVRTGPRPIGRDDESHRATNADVTFTDFRVS